MSSDLIISKAKPLLIKYGVKKSDLFGSFARGDADIKSDVDILVDVPSGTSLLDIIHLKRELQNALGKKVDLVTYRSVNKHLKKYIFEHTINII